MPDTENIKKRIVSFKHSDSSLTSKRVSIILSDPDDSAKLARAVRALRHKNSENKTFKVSDNTRIQIERETKRLR